MYLLSLKFFRSKKRKRYHEKVLNVLKRKLHHNVQKINTHLLRNFDDQAMSPDEVSSPSPSFSHNNLNSSLKLK